MGHRSILTASIAILVLVAGLLFLVLRQRDPSGGEARPSPPAPAAETRVRAPPARPDPVDLGSVLGLDSLSDCSRSPALASIVDRMVQIDPQTFESRRGAAVVVPGYDRPIVPTFERTREIEANSDIRAVTADLDLPGRWHGLAVIGLRRSFYEESDAASLEVRFAEPPERVRETLIRHGFRLAPAGELRELEGEGQSIAIGVERIEGGAALICAT